MSQKNLDDYDKEYADAYQIWHDGVAQKTAGMPWMQALGMLAILGGFQWPTGRCIMQEDIDDSDTDTVIYVLARQAGEGSDHKFESGD